MATDPVVPNVNNVADRFDDIVDAIKVAETVSNQLIQLTGDKDAAMSAEAVEKLVNLSLRLAQAGVRAYGAASGKAVTPESILALLPTDTPLAPADPPKAG